MRIVYLITVSDPIGGAQVHVRDLSSSLKALGHVVTVLVGNTGLFTEELDRLGIPYRVIPHLVRSINPWKDLIAVQEIRVALKQLRPDLLTTHSSKAGLLGRIAGRSLGIPTLFTAHGWAFTEGVPLIKRKIYSLVERAATPLASIIINVSEFDRQLAIKEGMGKVSKLITIHNGVADDSEQEAEPGIHPPKLVMVARFNEQKDHLTLFKALHLIRDLDWEIDLVGDGPLSKQLAVMASEIGLDHRIHFLGERNDVKQLLSRSQVFLLISNWEGLPLSILEAMRAQLPVVASDVGGVREVVADAKSGFLVPRGDEIILADRLGKLISDSKLRMRMGTTGRRMFEDNFTLNNMVDNTLSCYLDVLGKEQ